MLRTVLARIRNNKKEKRSDRMMLIIMPPPNFTNDIGVSTSPLRK
jgi:hypothetical protein